MTDKNDGAMGNMMEFVAKSTMEGIIRETFEEAYKDLGIDITDEDIEFGFFITMNLVEKGIALGNGPDNYDAFHAVLIREAVCSTILARKLNQRLNGIEEDDDE